MSSDGNFVLVMSSSDSFLGFDDEYYNSQTSDQNVSKSGFQLVFDERASISVVRRDGEPLITFTPSLIPLPSENYYRATLDLNCVFTQYYLPKKFGSNPQWIPAKSWPDDICINISRGSSSGVCGYNSLCRLENQRPVCRCPQGFSLADPNYTYGGCKPNYVQNCYQDDEDEYELLQTNDTYWAKNSYEVISGSTEEECHRACLSDCLCGAAIYRDSSCSKQQLPSSFGRVDATLNANVFLKHRKELNVSSSCRECQQRGGRCGNNTRNEFVCTEEADSKCPQSFQCGFLGSLEFPFSNMQPGCGLFMVNCGFTYPRIQLEEGGTWYPILRKLSENKFRIRDYPTKLDTWKCESPHLPSSPSSSLAMSAPGFNLIKCPIDAMGQSNPLVDNYFSDQNYSSQDCPDFKLYYRNSSVSFLEEFTTPRLCVQMPFQISAYSNETSGLPEQYLAVEFNLELNVSDACLKCHTRGGQCRNDSRNGFLCIKETGKRKFKTVLLSGGVCVTALSAAFLILFVLFREKYTLVPKWPIVQKVETGIEKDIELFFKNNPNLALKRYRSSDLKNMTNSFSDIVGKGGYGSVYKGKLSDGRLVAVKVLNESKQDGEEFMNELASISRTSHINIVTLLGFCFGGSKRALIYDFMPNGSLEKFILNTSSSSAVLGWKKLFEIALGIARGLEYLHQGCNMRILHFDIKPHNVLLDEDFNPKISDFGLAKLCPNRSSIVSMLVARGTIGYIAPEVFSRNFGEVSYKSDVYSYGMMILEMAGGRKNIDRKDVDRTSEIYFPHYIYKQLEMDFERDGSLVGIMNEEESQFAKKLIIVGLWCIQTNPNDRPSMTKVTEMLEGKLELLQVPPEPYIFPPPRSVPKSSTSVSMYSGHSSTGTHRRDMD